MTIQSKSDAKILVENSGVYNWEWDFENASENKNPSDYL